MFDQIKSHDGNRKGRGFRDTAGLHDSCLLQWFRLLLCQETVSIPEGCTHSHTLAQLSWFIFPKTQTEQMNPACFSCCWLTLIVFELYQYDVSFTELRPQMSFREICFVRVMCCFLYKNKIKNFLFAFSASSDIRAEGRHETSLCKNVLLSQTIQRNKVCGQKN